MNHKFNFFRTNMPETRKADYHLGCLNGSVFIDFNKTNNNQICMVRISFDGFGCYNLSGRVYLLDLKDSEKFIREIETENLDQEVMTELVKKAITINKEQIWSDALEKYKLID